MSLVGSFQHAGAGRRASRRTAAFAIAVLLIADLGGLYKVKARVRPVTIDQAVKTFREATGATGAPSEPIAAVPASASLQPASGGASGPARASRAATPTPALVGKSQTAPATASAPAPGVYVYATAGNEAVSALNTSHTYPAQTTMTVVATACGDDVRWDALKERWDLWHTCSSGQAIALQSFTTYHSFLGQVNERAYSCRDATYFRPATDAVGSAFAGRCTADDGSAAALSGKVVGPDTLAVDGTAVQTVRIRIDEVLTGATHGTRWSDSWYRLSDGLLIKRVSQTDADTKASFGDTHYTERLDLMLAALEPRR